MKLNRYFFPPFSVIFFVKLFIIHLFIFAIFRSIFIIKFLDQFNSIPFSEIIISFFKGIKTDSNIISYIIAPFFLISVLPYIQSLKIVKKIFLNIIALLFSIIFFLMGINLEFFTEYNSHLNYTAIEYLNSLDLIIFMAFKEYHLATYLIIFSLILGIYFYLLNKIKIKKVKSTLISNIIYIPICLFLLFFFIRGSLNQSQINWGNAYFSQYNMVNQASLNPIYNFYRDIYYTSIQRRDKLEEKISYYSNFNTALNIVKNMTLNKNETFIDENYPLYKKTINQSDEKKYNVVIILMEEFSAEFVGAFGNKLGLTPNFDKLASQGILFTNFFSNGQRTNKGLSATITSYPPLVGSSMMVLTKGQQKIVTLPKILKDNGYSTSFIYGGDVNYDNMKGFLVEKGVDKIISESDFENSKKLNKWGVADGEIFNKLLDIFDENEGKPFFSIVLTLTNHPPYTVPFYDYGKVSTGSPLDNNYNTFKYVDYELGKFFNNVQSKKDFKKTIFVILGDHSKTLHHDLSFDYRKSFVPCLYYAPNILDPKKVDKIVSQIDIAPTLLKLLGLSYSSTFWGKDMLTPKSEKDYALIVRNLKYGFIQNGFYLTGEFKGENNLYKLWEFPLVDYSIELDKTHKNLAKKVFAIEQVAYTLYNQRRIAKP